MGLNVMDYPVSYGINVSVYYDRESRVWWGYYTDTRTGFQMGDAWQGITKEDVLIQRPEVDPR